MALFPLELNEHRVSQNSGEDGERSEVGSIGYVVLPPVQSHYFHGEIRAGGKTAESCITSPWVLAVAAIEQQQED